MNTISHIWTVLLQLSSCCFVTKKNYLHAVDTKLCFVVPTLLSLCWFTSSFDYFTHHPVASILQACPCLWKLNTLNALQSYEYPLSYIHFLSKYNVLAYWDNLTFEGYCFPNPYCHLFGLITFQMHLHAFVLNTWICGLWS